MKPSIFRTLAIVGIYVAFAVIFLNRGPIVSAVTHIAAMLDLNNVFTGANTFPSINNIIYVDGNVYTTVAAAIAALPAAGGEIHVTTAFTPATLGTIDPGSKAITFYLAPETYNFTQIILRNNLHIFGSGSGGSGGGRSFNQRVPELTPLLLEPDRQYRALYYKDSGWKQRPVIHLKMGFT